MRIRHAFGLCHQVPPQSPDRRAHITRLREIFADVAADFGAELKECDGEHDHVHLLVEYPPAVAVSRMVNSLKGVSSRLLRKQFPNIRTHRKHLWSPSYFAASCGGAPLEIIKTYIQSQQTPTPLPPP